MRWMCLVAVLVCAGTAACGDDDSGRDARPTSAGGEATEVATADVTPDATPGPSETGFTLLPPAPFPGVAMYVELGCWQCDGQATGLMRIHRRADGSFHEWAIADATGLDGYFNGYAVSSDGWGVAVVMCTRGACANGFSEPSEDAQETIAVSRDGGVTFAALPPDSGGLIGFAGDELVLGHATADPLRPRLSLWPSGRTIEAPASARAPGLAVRAFPLPDGVTWLSANGRALVAEDGSEIMSAKHAVHSVRVVDASGDLVVLVGWDEGSAQAVWTLMRRIEGRFVFDRELRSGSDLDLAYVLSLGSWIGNVSPSGEYLDEAEPALRHTRFPALVEVDVLLVQPILQPFTSEPYRGGRNRIAGVVEGPFAMVTGAGDCLRIREAPSLGAKELVCVADNVLLRDGGETRLADGITWVRVEGPGGVVGWASGEFLER